MGRIFGTDGIRDRAGLGFLAPERVERLAQVAGSLLHENGGRFSAEIPAAFRHLSRALDGERPGRDRVLIGRDTRSSGPEIEGALVRGFRSVGVSVLRAGVLTTPGVASLTRLWGCALGVVISASHNPAEDNGIKFIAPQGFKIPDTAEEAIERLLESPDFSPRRPRRKGAARDVSKKVRDYEKFLSGFSRPLKGMKIAVDCAHGAASSFAGPVLERLGARVVVTNASPDGRNINAGCGALYPERVADVVRREKAHVGVAFDGDADRAILVDEKGEIRDGEAVLALCGLHLKDRKKLRGDTVVSTVMANFGLERHLGERGVKLLRTKVGDKFVAEEMLRSGAVLGGEPSGHVLFLDASPAGDGLLTTLRVLDTLAERGEPLSRAAFPKFPQILLNVPVARKPALEDVAGVRKAIAAAERSLGKDGRILVRYSGTESLCRVMVEGADATRVDRLARSVADTVRKELS